MKIHKFLIIGALLVFVSGALAGEVLGVGSGLLGLASENDIDAMFESRDTPLAATASIDTAITYQGVLRDDNNPANGSFDFRFQLFDDPIAGTLLGEQVMNSVTVADGQFSVLLDFGSKVYSAQAVWLEIAVQPEGGASYQTLTPRQAITAAPLALGLPNVSTDPNTGRVSIGGGSPISFAEVFGIKRDVNDWVGMYITGGGPQSRPFYGYATNDIGGKFAWTEYNGAADEWRLYTVQGNVFRVSVSGDVHADGSFSQPASANGLVKASALVECWSDDSFAKVDRSFNTVTNAPVTVAKGENQGECFIDFGFNLQSRYFSATAVQAGAVRGVTCAVDGSNPNRLRCLRWRVTGTGAEGWGGQIMVTIH